MIEINNLTTNSVNEEFLKKTAEKVLRGENRENKAELSIALVGEGRMREINKNYRGKNRVTDVLSFSGKKTRKEKFVLPAEIIPGLGEIIICLREVKKNAKKSDLAFNEELIKILIHGLLHLLGYDHEKSENQAVKMREKEQYYFNELKDIIELS